MLFVLAMAIPALIVVSKFPRLFLIIALIIQMMNLLAIRLLGDAGLLIQATQVLALSSCIAIYFKHNVKVIVGKPAVAIAFLAIYGLVQSFTMASPQSQLLSLKIFVYPFAFFLLRSSPRDYLRPILTAVCVLTCINAVAAVIEKYVGVSGLQALGLQYGSSVRTIEGELRSPGLLPTNFDLGLVCAVVFILCFYSVYLHQDLVARPLGLVTLAFSGIGLICSTTRSAFVIVLLALMVLLADVAITNVKRVSIYSLLSGALFYLLVSGSALGSDASFGQRREVWKNLINLHGSNFGLGFGRVGSITYSTYNEGGLIIFVDNYFLSLYLQLGVIGLLCFLASLLSLCKGTSRLGLSLVVGLIGSFFLLESWEYSLPMSLLILAVVASFEPSRGEIVSSPTNTNSELELMTHVSRA